MPPAAANAESLPHEIAGPLWYLPYPAPVLVGAGVVAAALLGLAVWALFAFWLKADRRAATAREKAMAALVGAKAKASEVSPYLFTIEVCDVLRAFLASEHRLPATTQTSYEFLQTARGSGVFDAPRLQGLTRFLDKADAIKFARADATPEDNLALAGLAEDLVKEGESDAKPS